jgi:hypothetical protein
MTLMPHGLHNNLLTKACANLSNNTSIMRQYRSKQQPIDRTYSQDELSSLFLSDRQSGSGSGGRSSAMEQQQQQQQTASTRPPPTIQKPARVRTGSLVRFADGCDTSGHPPIRQDVKGKSKAVVPLSLPTGGHYNGGNVNRGNNNSQQSTRAADTTPKQEEHAVSNGEHSPLLQECLLSSNNSMPTNNDSKNTSSPTPYPSYPPPPNYPLQSDNNATWTTENFPLTPGAKTLPFYEGQSQRQPFWNRHGPAQQQEPQQYAGYGAVTPTTPTPSTTWTRTTATSLPNRSDDPFAEGSSSREVGNRAYSMVSELSDDDDDVAANDGFHHAGISEKQTNGTPHLQDYDDDHEDDKRFEEEYGFDPDDKDDEITDQEDSSSEIVHGLNIETDSMSEPHPKRAINSQLPGHALDDVEHGRP